MAVPLDWVPPKGPDSTPWTLSVRGPGFAGGVDVRPGTMLEDYSDEQLRDIAIELMQ